MKRMLMWLLLMTKRLMKKPSFVIILVLLPVILVMYRFIITKDDGNLRAVVYVSEDSDGMAKAVAEGLTKLDSAVRFKASASKEELYNDVISGRAEVGYILPKDLESRFLMQNWSGSIIMVVSDTSQYASFINEFVTVEIYSDMMEDILVDYLMNKSGVDFDEAVIRPLIRDNLAKQAAAPPVFDIVYRDFYTNEELSKEEVLEEDYLTKPIRGTVALFVLLAGLAGLVFWFQDKAEGRFKVMSYEKRPVIHYGSMLLPTLLAGIVGIVCIFIAGLGTNVFREIAVMLVYCIFVAGCCEVIRVFVPSVNAVCAIIPILAIGSYLCCPIVLDLKRVLPLVVYLRKILPPDYYLQTFNGTSVFTLLIATAVVTVFSVVTELLDRR